MDKKSEYLSTMETQLKKWDADFDALAAEGEKASDAAGAQMRAGMKVAWETMQKTLEKVSKDLKN